MVRQGFLVPAQKSEEEYSAREHIIVEKAEPPYKNARGSLKLKLKLGLKVGTLLCSGSLITHSSGPECRKLITRTQPQLEPPH